MSAEDQNDDDFTLAPQEVVKDKNGEATRLTNPSTVRPEDRNEDDFVLAPQEVTEDEGREATRAAVAPGLHSRWVGTCIRYSRQRDACLGPKNGQGETAIFWTTRWHFLASVPSQWNAHGFCVVGQNDQTLGSAARPRIKNTDGAH